MDFVIIDDYPMAAHGISSMMSMQKNCLILAQASNIDNAIDTIIINNPDITIINLHHEDGYEIIKRLNKKTNSKFIMFLSVQNERDLCGIDKYNAHGYISNNAQYEDVLYAIGCVIRGKKYYDPDLIDKKNTLIEKNKYINKLTQRERDVLFQLENGLTNEEIANKLFITSNTVKKHMSQILSKLDLSDRTQAAIYSIKQKYITMI